MSHFQKGAKILKIMTLVFIPYLRCIFPSLRFYLLLWPLDLFLIKIRGFRVLRQMIRIPWSILTAKHLFCQDRFALLKNNTLLLCKTIFWVECITFLAFMMLLSHFTHVVKMGVTPAPRTMATHQRSLSATATTFEKGRDRYF